METSLIILSIFLIIVVVFIAIYIGGKIDDSDKSNNITLKSNHITMETSNDKMHPEKSSIRNTMRIN